jgi:hypothetical protein
VRRQKKMKKALLIVVALFVVSGISGTANAVYPLGYIGAYVDTVATHDYWCWYGPAYPDPAPKVWIWCKAGSKGFHGCEFALSYSTNLVQGMVTKNDDLNVLTIGDLINGISVTCDCQWDWCWVLNQVITPKNTTAARVYIVIHPVVGKYRFINCDPGYPKEDCILLNHAWFNKTPCPAVGVEESSWGAIKNLFNE